LFCALYGDDNKPKRFFLQRTFRQIPVTGGVTTYAESIDYNKHPDIVEYGLLLLDELKWEGMAMIEFIVDERDKTPKFIEINPRVYGPVQLAIDSGVDFPHLMYRIAEGEDIGQEYDYDVGRKIRWFFGDVRHFAKVMRGVDEKSLQLPISKTKTLMDFLKFIEPKLTYYILSLDDPQPNRS